MKIRITIIVCITHLALAGGLHAQYVVNAGARIVNQAGTAVVITGDYINGQNGNIVNHGSIILSGNWINNTTTGNLLEGSTGPVIFSGTSLQTIDGTAPTHFYDLLVQSEVQVGSEILVQHHLELFSHNVHLVDGILWMDAGSLILGAGPAAYVHTTGAGRLVQVVGDWSQFFPVGTAGSYCPLELHNHISGSDDFFLVHVFPDVLEDGTSGSTLAEIDHCVGLTWNLEKMNPGEVDLSVTAQWNGTDEGPLFDRTQSGLGHYLPGSGWSPQPVQAASGTGPYYLARHDNTAAGAFAVGDILSPLAGTLHLTLDATVILEGPFNGSAMTPTLNAEEKLPLEQPFAGPPWNYPGTESVGGIPNENVVDWLLVELRDAPSAAQATPATTVERKAAFLLADGTIVGMDGLSDLELMEEVIDGLFVVVWHRNHLGVMSAYPLEESGGTYSYDFTVSSDMAYGGTAGHKELVGGTWGMFAGDGDANGVIDPDDHMNVWVLQAGEEGYQAGDFNLDGQVSNPDKNNHWVENLNAQSQVPE